MNKYTEIIKKISCGLKIPAAAIAALFENEISSGYMYGLISSAGWFILYNSSPSIQAGMATIPAILIGLAIIFFVGAILQTLPNGDELYGRAQKREVSIWIKGIFWIMGITGFIIAYFFTLRAGHPLPLRPILLAAVTIVCINYIRDHLLDKMK
jgi:hypothetical protein